jgi:general secretion pathway protein J
MNRDILQLSDRGVRDILGDPTGALLIGSDGLMEFTRLGWRNPLQVPRAELQRVAYVLKDGDLYRSWWGMLDRTEDTEPALQRLLSGVERLEFYAVDASGNEHTFWPVTGLNEDDPANRLVGVIARIEVAPFGVVERIWHVPNV